MVWYGMVLYGMLWYGMLCYAMVLYGVVPVWCGIWYGVVSYGMIVLTIAMEQYTKAVFATDTRNKLPVLFQLRPLDKGTAMKAAMARRQPVRCHTVMPSTLMTRGNTTSCSTAAIKPAARNT